MFEATKQLHTLARSAPGSYPGFFGKAQYIQSGVGGIAERNIYDRRNAKTRKYLATAVSPVDLVADLSKKRLGKMEALKLKGGTNGIKGTGSNARLAANTAFLILLRKRAAHVSKGVEYYV